MIKLYNTLTRRKNTFSARNKKVGLYTCGPTVYNYAHIGNLRTYIFEDLLKRVLKYNGFDVYHVMNITDVGHLTNDSDMGEDKVELEARKERKTAREIAKFYTQAFKNDLQQLNIQPPDKWAKATDYIPQQIELVKKLETKGYTYKTSDGIYFDTSKFSKYDQLSHQPLSQLKEGARIEKNKEKKNPTDFALWKFSPKNKKRQMEWPSPWGIGFPGWHLECAAISSTILKNNRDIHCGGIDHIDVHHTNEIAEYEAAYNKKFFRFWMHGAFLNIKGGKKMAKSAKNFLNLENAILREDINPLAYRYAALQVHYRKSMEYSKAGIKNAFGGLNHLYNQVRDLKNKKGKINIEFKNKFLQKINDDLNLPGALAIIQKLLKSKLKDEEKLATIIDFDKVLGLDLNKLKPAIIPSNIQKLIKRRQLARDKKIWQESDDLRKQIENLGYRVEDTKDGQRVLKI